MLVMTAPLVPTPMTPGHQASAGTRCPPSHRLVLKPRSGPFEPAGVAPLSERKKTNVRSASSSRRSVSTIAPMPVSISSTISR